MLAVTEEEAETEAELDGLWVTLMVAAVTENEVRL